MIETFLTSSESDQYSITPKEISKFPLMYMTGYFCRSVYIYIIDLAHSEGLLRTKLKLFDLSRCGSPDNLAVYVILMLQVISQFFSLEHCTYTILQEGNL